MCGIAGIIRWDSMGADLAEISRLNDTMSYRGPDDDGIYLSDNVALAMSRLSIIDIHGGHQPLTSEDGIYTIVYNGEAYNYKSIKQELISSGAMFLTGSDTEVVLKGYIEWGAGILSKLNGMFAFAIYNQQKRTLFMARDRMGEKQIYYTMTNNYFVFGSEMKIPMIYDKGHRKLREDLLPEFLSYQYIGGPDTAVEGISLMPEACWVEIDCDKPSRLNFNSYWSLSLTDNTDVDSENLAAEIAYKSIVDSVKIRLTSDVPVSLMLSSGLDSNTLAYILSHELSSPLECFSLGFSDADFDETQDAGLLAKELAFPFHKHMISGKEVAEHFESYMEHNSSLQANTAQLIYYLVNKNIHDAGFKVTLNGNGGDEIFAGYPTYQATCLYNYYRCFPWPLKKAAQGLANLVPPSFGRVSWDYKLKKFCACELQQTMRAHGFWRTVYSPEMIAKLLNKKEICSVTTIYDKFFNSLSGTLNKVDIKVLMYSDLKAWLIPMLPWVDNVSMAHSVEMRLPFLDHLLVEKIFSFPSHMIYRNLKLKILMRRFLKNKVSKEIISRPKRGTHLPISRWLNTELKPLASHYLNPSVLNKNRLFDMKTVESMFEEHGRLERDNTFPLWNLIIFSAWQEKNRIIA